MASTSTLLSYVGPSWPHVGPSWDHLGAFLVPLGAILGPLGASLGPSWGPLGPPWGHPGAILAHLGATVGRLGGTSGPSWTNLGVKPSWFHLASISGLPGAPDLQQVTNLHLFASLRLSGLLSQNLLVASRPQAVEGPRRGREALTININNTT